MDLRTIWYSAEQIALKFSKQEFLTKTAEVLIKILHTIILFVLFVSWWRHFVSLTPSESNLPKHTLVTRSESPRDSQSMF